MRKAVRETHAVVGKPYDDVSVDQVQEEDLQALSNQHPVQIQPVAAVRAWKSWGYYHLIQKTCVFSDQEREDDACDEEEKTHAKIEQTMQ